VADHQRVDGWWIGNKGEGRAEQIVWVLFAYPK
jgi:hypothetical protein